MLKVKLYLVFIAVAFIAKIQAAAPLSIEDEALKKCIVQSMKKAGLSQPQQIIELKCHNKGIKTVSGL